MSVIKSLILILLKTNNLGAVFAPASEAIQTASIKNCTICICTNISVNGFVDISFMIAWLSPWLPAQLRIFSDLQKIVLVGEEEDCTPLSDHVNGNITFLTFLMCSIL